MVKELGKRLKGIGQGAVLGGLTGFVGTFGLEGGANALHVLNELKTVAPNYPYFLPAVMAIAVGGLGTYLGYAASFRSQQYSYPDMPRYQS